MFNFTKMHGNGNDFVIIDCRARDYSNVLDYEKIANRKIGIGCDQVILIDKSHNADCFMHVYNADGSKVEMCGNAARCLALLIMKEKKALSVTIELFDRILSCCLINNNEVCINIGKSSFFWKDIPLVEEYDTLNLPLEWGIFKRPAAVNVGNTHTVFFLHDIDNVPLSDLGPVIENHSIFPKKTNVGIAKIISKNKISLRVWERGVGETDSCGSGACAALVVAAKLGYTNRQALVILKGGDLRIRWADDGDIFMTGDATHVFSGQYNYN